jgi:hypothetical protein
MTPANKPDLAKTSLMGLTIGDAFGETFFGGEFDTSSFFYKIDFINPPSTRRAAPLVPEDSGLAT